MFLIDTNVFSELRRVARTDPNVRAWADAIQLGDTFMSSITVLEVERGALRVARRDPVQGKVLLAWLETLLSEYSGRILPVDVAVARQAAQLHVPDPRPEHDALIAATAIVHDMIVVTRNVQDFAGTGLVVLNPWEPGRGP